MGLSKYSFEKNSGVNLLQPKLSRIYRRIVATVNVKITPNVTIFILRVNFKFSLPLMLKTLHVKNLNVK